MSLGSLLSKKNIWGCILISILLAAGSSRADDVLIVGDSLMKSVAREFKNACGSRNLSSKTFTSIGTGLARLDLLDWHKKSKELIAETHPKLVIVMMGANDNQAMHTAGGDIDFGSKAWELEYGRRCGKMMDIMTDDGKIDVVWFGLPCMREKKLNTDTQLISRIMKSQAAARPKVKFISTYKLFSKDNKYSAYIIQKSGMPLDVRSSDGIHFNRNGARFLVKRVSSEVFKNIK